MLLLHVPANVLEQIRQRVPDLHERKPMRETKLKSYEAEFREMDPKETGRRHHKRGCSSDYERIAVVAVSFEQASQLAQCYGRKNFPKLVLVSVELQTSHVAI